MFVQPSVEEIRAIAQRFSLALVVQFGSSLDPQRIDHPESDIDLAFLSHPKTLSLEQEIDLQYQFAKLFGVFEDKIDLVNLAKVSSLLLYQVATKGVSLYDRDDHQFNEFYITANKRYIDEQNLRDLQKDLLTQKVASYA